MTSTSYLTVLRRPSFRLASLALAVVTVCAALLSPAGALVIFRPVPIKPTPVLPRLTAVPNSTGHLAIGATEFKLQTLRSSSELSALPRVERQSVLAQLNAQEAFKLKPVQDFNLLLAIQRNAGVSLANRVQFRPNAVLLKLMPQLGAEAVALPPTVARRALVAITHDDKVQVQILRKSADLTDADVASIADDLCAVIAEGALPLNNQMQTVSQIAEAFVDSTTRVQKQGLHSLSQQRDQVLLRAAVAANDPLMNVRVSQINAVREAGRVDFRINHEKFSSKVQFDAYSFATEVAKQPNSPNIEKLSLLPALW